MMNQNGFKLARQQARLWPAMKNNGVFRAQCVVLIEGDICLDTFEQAIATIVERHEILRTSFVKVPGMKIPLQVIAEEGEPYLCAIDLRGLSVEEQEAKVEDCYQSEQRVIFDYGAGWLARFLLIRLGEHKRIFIVTLPSLCADSRALFNLVEEIGRSYLARPLGDKRRDEVTQYLQFSEWQNELLQSEDAVDGRTYWDQQLPENYSLSLPFESASGPNWSFRPRCLSLPIDAKLTSLADVFVAERSVTRAEFLLAVWQTLLWRLTAQRAIIVRCKFHGRTYRELEDALGLFERYLPVRCGFEEDCKFLEVLDSVCRTFRETSDWQDYYESERIPEVSGEAPFCFDYEEIPAPRSFGGRIFSVLKHGVYLEPFKIKLSCLDRVGSLVIEFHYDSDLFSDGQIERLTSQFHRLLESALRCPGAPAARLEILTDAERYRLARSWNDTRAEYPSEKCVHQLFQEQVAHTPDHIAIVFEDEHLSYNELNGRANQLARRLRELGVGAETLVGVFMEPSIELLVGILGILKAGGAYTPLDPTSPDVRLKFMMEECGTGLLLTQSRLRPKLGEVRAELINLDEWDKTIVCRSRKNLSETGEIGRLAYVIFTSGTTGVAKGVMITHQGLTNYLSWCAKAYEVERGQGALSHSPISFDLTVTSLFSPLLVGRCVTLLSQKNGIDELRKALRAGGDYSLCKLTPSHLSVINQLLPPDEAMGRTRRMVIGGEALNGETLDFWVKYAPETRLINEYGPTETVVGCCVYEATMGKELRASVPIGWPISNMQVYIHDAHTELVPEGVVGELHIGGVGVARGYMNSPDLTAAKFIPDPHSLEGGARVYRSGDLGLRLRGGAIEYVGRIDRQVKIQGYRVEPEEIETALSQHEAMRSAYVELQVTEAGDKRLVAYIVLNVDEIPTGEIRNYLREKIPAYMIPSVFIRLAAMPLTPNGKVDRTRLPALEQLPFESERPFVAPQTDFEEILAGIWREVLGLERVGIDDNFFSLGGDSIRSVRVVALANNQGINFTTQDLFQRQTIRELSRLGKPYAPDPSDTYHTEPLSLTSVEDKLKLPYDIEDAYPLTMLQAGMLYHIGLSGDRPVYHNVNSYGFRCHFEPELFQRAVQYVVDRHPVLRTGFDLNTYSQPLQLVYRDVSFAVQVEDLRHLQSDAQERILEAFQLSETMHLFDISTPPLMRIHIHLLGDDSLQFTLTESHAISDGWSTTSTFAEIFNIYFALLDGDRLPEQRRLATSFRDFVKQERLALDSPACRQFWEQKLERCVHVELPARIPAAEEGIQGAHALYYRLPMELTEGVKALAYAAAVPLKTVLLAAHLKVISMISGRSNVVTGLTTNGRLEVIDGEQVRGLFLNTVPFCLDLSRESWMNLIRQTFESEREFLPYRRYPLSAIQQRWGQGTLLDTGFNFVHFHSLESVFQPGKLYVASRNNRDLSTTNFALGTSFSQLPASQELMLVLECDESRISEEQGKNIVAYYEAVIYQMITEPNGLHMAQPLLGQHELKWILVELNDTAQSFDDCQTLHRMFEIQVERTPDAVALNCDNEQLSFNNLNSAANRLARYLCSRGVGSEMMVGVLMDRSVALIVSLLGVLKAGAAFVPLDPEYPSLRLDRMIEEGALSVILTQEEFSERISAAQETKICVDREWERITGGGEENLDTVVFPDNLVYVLYTSGSTGAPKGAMVHHRGICNTLQWRQSVYSLSASDRILQTTSFSFDASVWEIFAPLTTGATLILMKREKHRELAYLTTGLRLHQITVMQAPPSLLRLALEAQCFTNCICLKHVICGGEVLTAELQEKFSRQSQARLHNHYGPTEGSIDATFWACERGARERTFPIGRPISNTEIYILDAALQPSPAGVVGDLYIGGVGVSRGYSGEAALTAERFIPHSFSRRPSRRLYFTGDLARYSEDGSLMYVGRSDTQVKAQGYRIELSEIEAVLCQHAAIKNAAVRLYQAWEPQLVGYVVLRNGEQLNGQQFREHVRRYLPDYMTPAQFVQLQELPLMPNGKVDRLRLPAPSPHPKEAGAEYISPGDDTERIIAEIWREVLSIERLGVNDNFFDLGGHSLFMLRVHNKLQSAFAREISLLELFQHPTVRSLAEYLRRSQAEPSSTQESHDRAKARRTLIKHELKRSVIRRRISQLEDNSYERTKDGGGTEND